MLPTPEEIVREHRKLAAEYRKRFRTNPEEAKAFLLRAGILTKSKSSPNGVRLAKEFRSEGQ